MGHEGLPEKNKSILEGEIIGSEEIDPILEKKFSELPEPVAGWWKDADKWKLIYSEQSLLHKSPEELIDIFTFCNSEYQTADQRLGIKRHPLDKSNESKNSPHDPSLYAKDITPREGREVQGEIDTDRGRRTLKRPE